MDYTLNNLGYANGLRIRDNEIRQCKSTAFQERAIPQDIEHYNFLHCLCLELQEKRLSCVDLKNSNDAAYVEQDSRIVQLWSTNYPGKVPDPDKIKFVTRRRNMLIANTDFEKVKQIVHPSPVTTLCYMEQRILFTGCADGSVRMYDTSYDLMDTWGDMLTYISDIHYNLHFDEFAVTSDTRIRNVEYGSLFGVHLYSFYRKFPVRLYFKHVAPTETARFNSTGMLLATADKEGEIYIVDARSTDIVRNFSSGRILEKKRLEFSPDGRFIAAKDVGAVNVFEIGTGRIYSQLPSSGRDQRDFDFQYCSFGRNIIVGGTDGVLKTWDFSTRLARPSSGKFRVPAPVRRIQRGKEYFSYCAI